MSTKLLWITQTRIRDIIKKGNSKLLWLLPEEKIFQRVYIFHLAGTEGTRIKRKHGSRIIRINIFSGNTRCAALWNYIRCICYMVLLCRRLRDRGHTVAVRATDPFMSGIIGLFISRVAKLRFYVSIHADYRIGIEQGCRPMPVPKSLLRWMYRLSTSRATAVLPISKYLRERIAEDLWYGGSPIAEPIYHYIDCDSRILTNKKSRYHSLDIMIVARLSRDKYSDLLPGVVKELVDSGWKGKLHVFGDGNLRQNLERECRLLPVEFYGFQEAETIMKHRSRVMFCLCLCDGATLIEAQMSGNICICTPNEWHSEVILDGFNGYMSKGMNVIDIAEAIRKAVSLQPDGRRILSENAMLTYKEKFSLEAIVRTRKSIYQKAVTKD